MFPEPGGLGLFTAMPRVEVLMRDVVEQDVKATFETLEGSDALSIWVEPVEWEGDLAKSPMKQLEVRVRNYTDSSTPQKPWDAFREMESNCKAFILF